MSETALAARLADSITALASSLSARPAQSISAGPMSALAKTVSAGPVSARDLARLEGVTPSAMSRTIGRLEAAGLIRRQADPADGRLQWISPTPEGRRLALQSEAHRLAPLVAVIAALADEDRQYLESSADNLAWLAEAVAARS